MHRNRITPHQRSQHQAPRSRPAPQAHSRQSPYQPITTSPGSEIGAHLQPDSLITYQQTIGNQAVQRLVATNHNNKLLQRGLEVNFTSKGDAITTLTAKGRPGWSAKATKWFKQQPGSADGGTSKGHMVEWSTKLRAFVNEWKGKPKAELVAFLKHRGPQDDGSIQKTLYDYLKEEFNNLANLAVNSTAQDNEAGGIANTLAQAIDDNHFPRSVSLNKEKVTILSKEHAIRLLYKHSFNPTNAANTRAHIEAYEEAFAKAWNIALPTLRSWSIEEGWRVQAVQPAGAVVPGNTAEPAMRPTVPRQPGRRPRRAGANQVAFARWLWLRRHPLYRHRFPTYMHYREHLQKQRRFFNRLKIMWRTRYREQYPRFLDFYRAYGRGQLRRR